MVGLEAVLREGEESGEMTPLARIFFAAAVVDEADSVWRKSPKKFISLCSLRRNLNLNVYIVR